MHADLLYNQIGYDLASYFRSAFIKVRRTAENATTDDFVSNFSIAPFCLAQRIGGLLVISRNSLHFWSGGAENFRLIHSCWPKEEKRLV